MAGAHGRQSDTHSLECSSKVGVNFAAGHNAHERATNAVCVLLVGSRGNPGSSAWESHMGVEE
jgi:hypothetical protein